LRRGQCRVIRHRTVVQCGDDDPAVSMAVFDPTRPGAVLEHLRCAAGQRVDDAEVRIGPVVEIRGAERKASGSEPGDVRVGVGALRNGFGIVWGDDDADAVGRNVRLIGRCPCGVDDRYPAQIYELLKHSGRLHHLPQLGVLGAGQPRRNVNASIQVAQAYGIVGQRLRKRGGGVDHPESQVAEEVEGARRGRRIVGDEPIAELRVRRRCRGWGLAWQRCRCQGG